MKWGGGGGGGERSPWGRGEGRRGAAVRLLQEKEASMGWGRAEDITTDILMGTELNGRIANQWWSINACIDSWYMQLPAMKGGTTLCRELEMWQPTWISACSCKASAVG